MKKRVAFIFPGQGAQSVGMGREFFEHSPQARVVFEQANALIPGLCDTIFNGPADKLTSTQYCQPGIFTFSVAALKALEAHPIHTQMEVCYACGLSLGEYAALVASGALSFSDALKLVERRSHFMEEAARKTKGAMAAVIGFDREALEKICAQTGAQVANFNAPDQIVITGEAAKVAAASAKIEEAGAKRVIPLDVGGAFHSRLMQSASDAFARVLETCPLVKPHYPVVSNVDALPQTDPNVIRKNLTLQIVSPVRWVDSINTIAAQGVNTFLEIGPGTVLKGLVRKINREMNVYNIQTSEDTEKLGLIL